MSTLLQINVAVNWGSTGKIAEQIGVIAQSKGWESYIAYGRDFCPSKNSVIHIGNYFDVLEHYAEHRLFDNDGLASRGATRKLIREIDRVKPDVIHLHNIHDHYVNYKLLLEYIAKLNIPVVWTLHDCWNFTGGCKYFDQIGCDSWKQECITCPANRSLFKEKTNYHFRLMRDLQEKVKNLTFVPVSNWLDSLLKQSCQGQRNSVVIHNGVDLNTFKPCGTNKSNMILGVASVWDSRKGLNDFIRLRTILSKNLSIILVGLTKGQIKKLPEGIIGITQTTNQKQLAQLYSDAMAFVNPTYSDNFPTTNIEALGCGTPVITYRTGGSPEAVDEATGMVIEKGDVEGLASAILKVVNNPELYPPSACRKRAVEHFNKETQFAKYINLYTDLVNRKN